jgi:hypothetical protein
MQTTTLNHAIHRFTLNSKTAVIEMPSAAVVTGFAPSTSNAGSFNIWALVCTDENAKTEKRAFAVVAVGEAIPASAAVTPLPCPPLLLSNGTTKTTYLTLMEVSSTDAPDWKGFGQE